MKRNGYAWHKVEDRQPKLGYEGSDALGYTPCIWVTNLHDIELEEPLLDEMIPEFLEKYQKRVKKLIEDK